MISTADMSASTSFQQCMCSLALSDYPVAQMYWTCLDCISPHEDRHMILCLGCIKQCHAGHETIEATYNVLKCECSYAKVCKIEEKSRALSEELLPKDTIGRLSRGACGTFSKLPFADVHELPSISEPEGKDLLAELKQDCNTVLDQLAMKSSRWLGADSSPSCLLEEYVMGIFKYHVARFGLETELNPHSGAEWRVQCLNPDEARVGSGGDIQDRKHGINMDQNAKLRFQTDELLLRGFNAFICPDLGTITFLSEEQILQPALLLDYSVSDPVEKAIRSCMVVHPRLGKHVSFNGTLLQGSSVLLAPTKPFGPELQQTPCKVLSLHVNIWIYHKPIGIQELTSSDIEAFEGNKLGQAALRMDLCIRPAPASAVEEVLVSTDDIVARRPLTGKGCSDEKDRLASVALSCFRCAEFMDNTLKDDENDDEENDDDIPCSESGAGHRSLSVMMWRPPQVTDVQCSDQASTQIIKYVDDTSAAFLLDLAKEG